MSTNIFNRVVKTISENLEVELEKVLPESRITDDLGADSLDTVELIMALEEEFGIEVELGVGHSWLLMPQTINQILPPVCQRIPHSESHHDQSESGVGALKNFKDCRYG